MNKIKKTFTVTEDHLTLLKHLRISWDDCEFGAPCIDPQSPYGSLDVYGDMGEILSLAQVSKNNSLCYEDFQIDYMRQLHEDLEICLQILCQHLKIEAGEYRKDENGWGKLN